MIEIDTYHFNLSVHNTCNFVGFVVIKFLLLNNCHRRIMEKVYLIFTLSHVYSILLKDFFFSNKLCPLRFT